jgi:hypothetical protein
MVANSDRYRVQNTDVVLAIRSGEVLARDRSSE